MKLFLVQALGVLLCLALSLVIALTASALVPTVHGPVHLEKPYSEYTQDELRELFKKQHAEEFPEEGLLSLARDRGVPIQALVWILGILFFRPPTLLGLTEWLGGLGVGLTLGLFGLVQASILGFATIVAFVFIRCQEKWRSLSR